MDRFLQIMLEGTLIFLIVFTPFAFGSVEQWSTTVIELSVLLILAMWGLKLLVRGKVEFIKSPLNLLVVFWVGFIVVQYFLTTVYQQATQAALIKSFSFCVILLAVLNNIQTKKQLHRVVTAVILTGLAVSLLGIVQKIFWDGRIFWMHSIDRAANPFGPYVNKNHYAGYISMVIPVSIGFLFSYNGKKCRLVKTLVTVATAIMAGGMLYSLSRSGTISMLASLLFMALLLIKFKSVNLSSTMILIGAAILIVCVSLATLEPLARAFSNLNDVSWQARLWVWKGTAGIIDEHWLTGSGLGTFVHVFPGYRLPATRFFFDHVHNDLLELMAETGTVGFAIIFGFAGWFLVRTARRLSSRRDVWALNITAGFLASLAAIFIFSMSDFNLHIPANMLLFCIVTALVVVSANLRPEIGEAATYCSRRVFVLRPIFRKVLCLIFVTGLAAAVVVVVKPFLAQSSYRESLQTKSTRARIDCLEQCIKLQPRDARYYYKLGRLRADQREWGLALRAFDKAAKLDPNSGLYQRGLALAYSKIGMNETAFEHLKAAVECEPNNPYHHRKLALYYLENSDGSRGGKYLEAAKAGTRKTLSIKPEFTRNAIEIFSGHISDYDELKTIIPDTPAAHMEFCKYLKEQQMEEKAGVEFQLAIAGLRSRLAKCTASEAVEIHHEMADAYQVMGLYDEAVAQLQQASVISPYDSWTFYRLGMAYGETDDRNGSVDALKKSIAFGAADGWAYYSLARIYQSEGRPDRARAMWNSILKRNNVDPETVAIAKRELTSITKINK
jgi:tetratricopeptide (TPR) repeat protein/O-antigen ligase